MNKLPPYPQASKQLSLRDKVGQSFMPAAFINDTEEDIAELERIIRNYGVGGICFFHSRASAATNFEGPKEIIYNEESLETLKRLIKRYQKAANYPLLISIDAEWGLAMRIENTPQYPYAITLGAMKDQEALVYLVGQHIGQDCFEAGIHWNFAPVADINNNPLNPVIGYRSFGENPGLVARYALAFCQGLQSAGILTSAKHFPGHGDTATDSHLGLPIIDKSYDQLSSNELRPFVELITHGVDSVMVGHLVVPVLSDGKAEPASISKSVIQGYLRKKLGFNGVVVSDALNMHSVSKRFTQKGDLEQCAYRAGTDVLCYSQDVEAGISKIIDHESEASIEEHFKRVWNLKERIFNATEYPVIDRSETYESLMVKLAEQSLCGLRGDAKILETFHRHGFQGIAIGKKKESQFLQQVNDSLTGAGYDISVDSIQGIEEAVANHKRVLLAIYPPKAKPADNFGFEEEELKLIERITTNKDVILYLFGNPYVLNLFKRNEFRAIWVAFQDFPEFQHNAARHFLGEIEAPGTLPVTLAKN